MKSMDLNDSKKNAIQQLGEHKNQYLLVTELPLDETSGLLEVGDHVEQNVKVRTIMLDDFDIDNEPHITFQHIQFNPVPKSSFKYIKTRKYENESP